MELYKTSRLAFAVGSNTAFQLVGKVVSMSITILATIIITRMYGRSGYGAFNLMQSLPALFFIIADFGFNAIASRELSKDFTKAEKYLGTVLIMRLLTSLGLMILAALFIVFSNYSYDLKFGLYLSVFLILTQALFATTNIIFQVKLRYDLSTIGYVVGSFVVLGLVLILSWLRVDIGWVNFSYVVGGLVTFLINLYFIRKKIGLNLQFTLDPIVAKFVFAQSVPLGLMFVFSQINFRSDVFLLSFLSVPSFLQLSNIDVVAVYGLPYKIFEVALVVPTFFMNAAYPIFVKHLLESKQRFLKTFKVTLFTLVVLSFVGSVAGLLFADYMVYILGGSEFDQSAQVLRLLLVGLPFFYISQPISWLIVTLEKQNTLPLIYLIGAVFNVSLNYVLIPLYSVYASAALTWVSEVLILIMLTYVALKSFKNYS